MTAGAVDAASAVPGRVGFVGAGQLGGPMVDRLFGAGVGVRLYARRPEVGQRWRDRGVETAADARELAATSDVLIACLYSDVQLRELVLGPDGIAEVLPPGSVLVSHTTCAPSAVDDLRSALADRSVGLVDAPVSGTAAHIARGELTVLLGGDDLALDRVEPLLATYCSTRLRTGGVGSATRMKLVNNIWFAANVQVTALAVRLAEQLGLGEDAVLASISHCSANSAALGFVREFGSVATFGERVGHYLRKDVGAIQDAAEVARIDLGLLEHLVSTGPLDQLHP
jgi:3-hydroxyisobutyrate dehydrogenase-like beta-hydroxyacid dehydrogenase